jgi:hypothetical protein
MGAYTGVLLIGVLVLVYIGTYFLNKTTPVPEECLDDLDTEACTACKNYACSLKK